MWFNRIRNARGIRGKTHTTRPAQSRAVVEFLEGRQLLSAAPTHPAPVAAVTVAAVKTVGETFRAQAGTGTTGDVGVLTGVTNVAGDFRNLQASIDWGDGSDPTAGTFSRDARGRIHVRGTHTYAAAGNYAVTVGVSLTPIVTPGQPNPFFAIRIATIQSRAVVTAADGGVHLTEVATRPFTATLGSFHFLNVDLRLVATITWGDGKQSAGEVVRTAAGSYDVVGAHTYARTGTYKVHVAVTASPFGGPTLPGVSPVAAFDSTIDVKSFA